MAKIIISILLLVSSFTNGQPSAMFYAHNFTQQPLLLDLYPSADAAYSFFKLRNTYNGYCIQVRRLSDTVTLNVGFVNNFLDTNTLKSFISSSSGMVSIFYDQSGNNRDLKNTVLDQQPRIVNAGTVDGYSGQAAVYFTGQKVLLTDSTTIGFKSVFAVTKSSTSSGTQTITRIGNSVFSNAQAIRFDNSNFTSFGGNAVSYLSQTSTTPTNKLLLTTIFNPTLNQYINSVTGNTDNTGTTWTPVKNIYSLGALLPNINENFSGYINFLLIYNTDQSSNRTGIETIINNLYSIY